MKAAACFSGNAESDNHHKNAYFDHRYDCRGGYGYPYASYGDCSEDKGHDDLSADTRYGRDIREIPRKPDDNGRGGHHTGARNRQAHDQGKDRAVQSFLHIDGFPGTFGKAGRHFGKRKGGQACNRRRQQERERRIGAAGTRDLADQNEYARTDGRAEAIEGQQTK